MTDASWTPAQALDLGVVAKVVADEEVDTEGLALAHRLANAPSEIIGLSKLILLKAFESSLDDIMMFEDLGQSLAMSSAEFQEGLAALREKRKPDFVAAAKADPHGD